MHIKLCNNYVYLEHNKPITIECFTEIKSYIDGINMKYKELFEL